MIVKEIQDGYEVYSMQNDKLSVYLCPSLGNNLFRMWDRIRKRDVLRVPGTLQELQERPIYFGIPVLFPPNRTRYGRFEFQGRIYQLDINWENKHNNHGFLALNPWTVTSTMHVGNSQVITSTLATIDFPHILAQYPHDLLFVMTYELRDDELIQYVSITNRGAATAPIGFGLHPWFLLDYEPEKWTLQLPASYEWELDSELIPTGKMMELPPNNPLEEGISLLGLNMEKLFFIGNSPHTAILSHQEFEIRLQTSELYKHWLIYTKGTANEVICIEPYTSATNAPNLKLPNEITGLIALEQNETIYLNVKLTVSTK